MEPLDPVFRALADPSRRRLLDRLNRRNGQSLLELCDGLELTRQAVTKHLAVLEAAGLVTALRRGRQRLHYLNAAPIEAIADRWLSQYDRARARALADLKLALEDRSVSNTAFVYVNYIGTTPERLWQALTDRAWITRYFNGGGPDSDWQVGSPITWRIDGNDSPHEWGQRVLEAEPNRRLVYSWHNYQPEMASMFGWSDERLAELRKEPISKVTFQIEPIAPDVVKLTVIHDDFAPDAEMLKGISEGWPMILSFLKTVLEASPAATPSR
jgi:uncharacterized protein YndB with AHSA1/START domain/DNA-binding transcriptional ArsR family regulator